MSTTVYTYNDKVLKNVATDKWLKKPDAPAGFVMNASNATIQSNTANWESPTYPDGYDGQGKTLQIIVKEEGFTCNNLSFQYTNTIANSGPGVIDNGGMWLNPNADHIGGETVNLPVGTYNVSIIQNVAVQGGYGKYITMKRNGSDYTIDSTLLSKLEFRIID